MRKENEKNIKLDREIKKRQWIKVKENGGIELLFYVNKDKIKTKIDEINSLKYSDERLDRATIDFIINKFYRLLEEE